MSDTAAAVGSVEETLNNMKGALAESLTRGSKKIKADRAVTIVEGTQLIYKRAIEDLEMDIKNTSREQANQLDLSPNSSESLVVAANFDPLAFVQKDQAYTLKLRELRIRLEEYKTRYAVLFG